MLAVDHDLLSFVDARLGDWPLILVTNPKDAQFLAPHHEPTESIKYSTHIRSVVTHNVSASQCPQIPPNTPYTSGGNPSNTSHTSGQWSPTMSVLHSVHKFHQTLHTHQVVIHQTLHTHQVSGYPQCQCFTVSTNSTKHSTHIQWSSNKHFTHIRSVVTHNVSASQCPQIPLNTPHTLGGHHQSLHTHQVSGHPHCQCFTVRVQESIKHSTHIKSVVTHNVCASQSECRSPSNTSHTSGQWSPTVSVLHSQRASHTSGQWSPTVSVLHSQSAGVH